MKKFFKQKKMLENLDSILLIYYLCPLNAPHLAFDELDSHSAVVAFLL